MSRSRVTFETASQSLLDASLDPSRWSESMGIVAQYAGAVGAALLPMRDRNRQMPHSEAVSECIDVYFRDGWHLRDERDRGIPLLQRRPIFADQDFASREELETSDYYRGFVAKFDLNWSACIGMSNADDAWCMVIGRGDRLGPFDDNEKADLVRFSDQLNKAAVVARHLACSHAVGTMNAYESMGCATFLLDRFGQVVRSNAQAERLLGDGLTLSKGELRSCSSEDTAAIASLIAEVSSQSEAARVVPIVTIRRPGRRPLLMRGLNLKGLEGSIFAPAKSMLLVSDMDKTVVTPVEHLRAVFHLTTTEATLVSYLEQEMTLLEIGDRMGIALETVRFYLKRIFVKTETNRQSDLLMLIRRIPSDQAAPVWPDPDRQQLRSAKNA